MVSTLNQKRGCIISYGTWYAAGTCATFRVQKASGSSHSLSMLECHISSLYANLDIADDTFTLKSSKGLCAFEDDVLQCGSHVGKASEFTVCHAPQIR